MLTHSLTKAVSSYVQPIEAKYRHCDGEFERIDLPSVHQGDP